MPKRSNMRQVVAGDELQEKIKKGVNTIFDVALSSYGVNSGNVIIEHRFGEPLISHDGITNIGKLVVQDSIENSAISVVRQASEKTNRVAGDATTLTVVLTKLAYDYWVGQGFTPRKTQQMMEMLVADVKRAIKEQKLDVTDDTLRGVARISAGDQAIGDMVYDAVKTVGKAGGITVVEQAIPEIGSEIIDGFTFKKGLKAVALASDIQALKSRYNDPAIVVMPRLITKNDEIVPILDQVIISGKTQILLIADVSGQALETIIANKLKGVLDIAVVEPPFEDRDAFMNDVARYASTKVFIGATDEFNVMEHCGTAESVYVTLSETTINGCKTPKELAEYCKEITDEKRLERLNGKTVKISVGAPTQAERQELKLRIEDAVCAAQTSLYYGVLPGGGVFLRDFDKNGYLSWPFRILTGAMPNEGDTDMPELPYKPGEGMDIFSGKDVPNMVDAFIVDSAKAVEEAVVNAHSAAAQLISVRMALPYVDNMD